MRTFILTTIHDDLFSMNPTDELPEHVRRNSAAWDKYSRDYVNLVEKGWKEEPHWGIWHIPEEEVRLLPDVNGLDAIELGCGTAYLSSWLARRGARVTGIDISEEQLKTARRQQRENNLYFPLIHGNAEKVPLPDASFDFAISEYGASIWCDPYRWIPEASRLLRPNGQLIFLVNGTILMLCMIEDGNKPATPQIVRSYFGMHRFEWNDGDDSVEFHLGYGDWIRLLRKNNFEIENLIELRPSEGATTTYPFVNLDWARQWPSEEAWIVRKRGA
ncbi:MAG: class I SAM-dependent methyltransferase [Thaumarchaeota archaeon]|nr:class I SAM-dependent methyltransferase [Nitrososphaerota archaeon]